MNENKLFGLKMVNFKFRNQKNIFLINCLRLIKDNEAQNEAHVRALQSKILVGLRFVWANFYRFLGDFPLFDHCFSASIVAGDSIISRFSREWRFLIEEVRIICFNRAIVKGS